jgi:hypothetical protein
VPHGPPGRALPSHHHRAPRPEPPPVAPTDPAVVAATAIANNPSTIWCDTGGYSACGTQQRLVSPATSSAKLLDYYRRAQNQLWQKPSPCASIGCPVIKADRMRRSSVRGENDYTCTETTTRIEYLPVGYDLRAATGENLPRQ